MKPRVTREISVSEMLRMRETLGMSNGEIAEKCGCCLPTVLRMIGKSNMRRSTPKGYYNAELQEKESHPAPPAKVCNVQVFCPDCTHIYPNCVYMVLESGQCEVRLVGPLELVATFFSANIYGICQLRQ